MTNTPTMEEVLLDRSPLADLEPIAARIFALSMRQALRRAGFIHRSEVLSEEAVELGCRIYAEVKTAQAKQLIRSGGDRVPPHELDRERVEAVLASASTHADVATLLAALGEEKADG